MIDKAKDIENFRSTQQIVRDRAMKSNKRRFSWGGVIAMVLIALAGFFINKARGQGVQEFDIDHPNAISYIVENKKWEGPISILVNIDSSTIASSQIMSD